MVKEFVSANTRALKIHYSDIAEPNAYLTRDVLTKHNGMRSLTYQQKLDGKDIYGATFAINLTKDNEVINVSSRALFLDEIRIRKDKQELTAEQAIEAAVRAVGGKRKEERGKREDERTTDNTEYTDGKRRKTEDGRQKTEETTEYTDNTDEYGYGEDGLVRRSFSEGGRRTTEEGTFNIQHPTSNVQHSTPKTSHLPPSQSPLTPDTQHLTPPTDAQAKLVYFPRDMMSAVLAWDVVVQAPQSPETHHIILDAETGEVLLDQLLTWSLEPLTMLVYTNDSPTPFSPGQSAPTNYQPPEVSRMLVTLTALDTNASPAGWINDGRGETSGNNIDAYSDWNDDNSPDSARPQGSPYRVFSNSLSLAGHPTNYLNAAIVQAFYLGNVFHDKLYALGFDEAAGNFQTNNFGRGGKDRDAVKIEVQDGAGSMDENHINNAYFTAMSDGYSGRMQLYLWTRVSPYRDSALDAEVVFHEYAHGVSGRLIGDGYGLSGTQPKAMGEGWSDFMALSLLSEPDDDVNSCYAVGAYSGARSDNPNNYYYGIRRFPYTTDTNKAPQTLADTDPAQIGFPAGAPINPTISNKPADDSHRAGEIWCLALWGCRANLMGRYGFAGNEKMLQLVVDGMKLTPMNPTFIQARDAILQADMVNNGGTNRLELWKGFAKRGLGYSASVPASSTITGVKESFDLPINVATVVTEAMSGDGDGYVEPGEAGELEIRLTSYEQALHSVMGTLSVISTNVTVLQGNTTFPDIVIGGVSTSAVPFQFSVNGGFPGFTDAGFLLTVGFAEGNFTEQVLIRIGNPYDYAPEITGVTVTNVGETNAAISWLTGIPAYSQVHYGTTTNYGQSSQLDAGLATNHTVGLNGLTKGTTYHFSAVSRGTNGLLGVSSDQTFTTKARIYVHVNSAATQELGTIGAPYKTLQAAANAANSWDELLVAEGRYTGTGSNAVLIVSKNLKVYGGYDASFAVREPDRHVTTIDGENARRGLNVTGVPTLEIYGIHITGCAGEWGGGAHVDEASLSAGNCVFSNNSSTNGNWFGGAIYGADSSIKLLDCVISNNTTRNGDRAGDGGGVLLVSDKSSLYMTNCIVADNTAGWSGGLDLGGWTTGILSGCIIYGNVARGLDDFGNENGIGGGIRVAGTFVLNHCTIAYNMASATNGIGGGGVWVYDALSAESSGNVTFNNCIVYSNICLAQGADLWAGVLLWNRPYVRVSYSDIGEVSGELDSSVGRINADPLFVAPEAGDFHLKSNSPCIDAGMALDDATYDMDGESRPFGPAMDIGADEYTDTDLDELPNYWENVHGLNPTNSVGNAGRDGDSDNDGLKNWAEFIVGTDPTNRASVFKFTAGDFPDTNSIVLKWASASGRRYNIRRATNLSHGFDTLATNMPATPPLNTYTDDTVVNPGPWFYRIAVDP